MSKKKKVSKITKAFSREMQTPINGMSFVTTWGDWVVNAKKILVKVIDFFSPAGSGSLEEKIPPALGNTFSFIGTLSAVVSFPASIVDLIKKYLKLKDFDRKITKYPGLSIKNLPPQTSLTFKIFQVILSAINTTILGALAYAAVVIFKAKLLAISISSTSLWSQAVAAIGVAALWVGVLISAVILLKSIFKFLNAKMAEQKMILNLESLNKETCSDYKTQDLRAYLRNENVNSVLKYESCKLNSNTSLTAKQMKEFLDLRDVYHQLKKLLIENKINPQWIGDAEKIEMLEAALQGKEKIIKQADLDKFIEFSDTYHLKKEEIIQEMGGRESFKDLMDWVSARKAKLTGNLISKGIGLALAIIGLVLGIFTGLPMLGIAVLLGLTTLWTLIDKFADLPWKKWGQEARKEPEVRLSDREILCVLSNFNEKQDSQDSIEKLNQDAKNSAEVTETNTDFDQLKERLEQRIDTRRMRQEALKEIFERTRESSDTFEDPEQSQEDSRKVIRTIFV